MELILLFLGWIVLSHVVAAIVPPLIELIPELFAFLFQCLWAVIKLLFRASFWLLLQTARAACLVARALWLAHVMLFFVMQEWQRGALQDEEAAADHFPNDESEQDGYTAALELLGLTPGFTQKALKSAYRVAMRAAHPDAGGSAQAAQAVNGAYELILHAHGWAR